MSQIKLYRVAYLGYCRLCHHLHADVDYIHLLKYFLGHATKCHHGTEDFTIIRISSQDYKDYLKNKDNPKFWRAWRHIKKPQISNPLFGLVRERIIFLLRLTLSTLQG